MTDAHGPRAALRTTVLAVLALACGHAAAQSVPASCSPIVDDAARLECYDRAVGRVPPAAPAGAAGGAQGPMTGSPLPGSASPAPGSAPAAAGLSAQEAAKLERDERRARGGSLGERWELDPGTKQGRFLLRPYKPMYVLPVRWSDDPNQQPTSDGPNNSVSAPQDLRSIEAAFQISLKSKIWETVGGTNLDVWLGYTQKSHWQLYAPSLSRPFRETDYEPEVFGIWGFDQPLLFGWRARFLGLGFNHQSNGRSEPLSRSWNRVIAQAGFENGDWSVLVRPWWRISESPEVDDNPGIENWLGRGELVITRRAGAHQVSAQLRHSLRGGDQSRGSVTLDWAFPLSSYLKGHVQLFTGYGESLIDFNHRQTTIGLGFSLVEWQ
ncbi:MAG: phospholipase [Burkholderiales bacterium]|nr:MAG: phospholipase [Burkholderiales bacterium]